MAFDFNNEIKQVDSNNVSEILDEGINLAAARGYMTDCFPVGDYTGREYLEKLGYFDSEKRFYMVDPRPYLDLFPATSKNFGISIWEPGANTSPQFDEKEFERPQLVFQQVYCELIDNELKEAQSGTLLHYFKGIYKATKGVDGKPQWEKLWNVFIFDPYKQIKN